jgi:hypothetical protein
MQLVRIAGLVGVGVTLVGCYTLQPARGVAPQIGQKIAFDVNDVGRAALGGSMGPEIDQIEGRLLQRDTTQYVVAVAAVRMLRGGEQAWSGEPVKIKPEYVGATYVRQFSRGRTLALGAIGVGAVALIASQSLLGGGDNPGKTPNDTAAARIIPRP